MATDPSKPTPAAPSASHKGVRIFTYPKIIFILPTMVAALICGIGMMIFSDNTADPTRSRMVDKKTGQAVGEPLPAPADPAVNKGAKADGKAAPAVAARRFSSPQNVLGMIFLFVFAINLVIMAIDFPRFTVIALILSAAAAGFFILWLNVYFDLLPPLIRFLESFYAVANAGFYFGFALILFLTFAIIWTTRYLDYWEILPNEILHNHGPFSDLERYPTFNLKFDKEIPDILEYALLRSGRLVLHVQNERKSIVLDNVLWIDHKETALKKLLSRMDVRITTDQEASEPA